jgi:ABC-type bacteriocin/lantibiotic exporter with double-glycine peptidase domain
MWKGSGALKKAALALTLLASLLAGPVLTSAIVDDRVLRLASGVTERLPLRPKVQAPLQKKLYDCGPAVLAEALRRRGIAVRSEDIEALAGTTPRGTTMLGLQEAAAALGVRTEGVRLTFQDLRRTPLPAIVFVRDRHFVLVTSTSEDAVTVLDPAAGQIVVGRSQFLREWRGEALVFADRRPATNTGGA